MKKILFIIAFPLLLSSCNKEDVSPVQSDYFIKFFGNYLEDTGLEMAETSDGGLIIAGGMEDPGTGKKMVMLKVDDYGNPSVWSPKKFGEDSEGTGHCVMETSNGYLLAGSVNNEEGKRDAILIRTDKQGEQLGNPFIYSGADNEYPTSIARRPGGGFMVVGYQENSSTGARSLFIITIDEDLSNPRITTTRAEGQEFLSVFFNKEDEYIAVGNQYSGNQGTESQFFIAKINESGNIFDLAFIGSPTAREVMTDVVRVNETTMYILGTVSDAGSPSTQVILKKVVNMREEWSRRLITSGDLEGKAITLNPDGGIIVAADKKAGGDKNILIYFLDDSGNEIKSVEYGNTGDQVAEDLIHTGNNLIILGRNTYQGNSMITLIKTDKDGNVWE